MNKTISGAPEGYSSITPYLIVDDATAAINFYMKIFAATEIMRMEKPDGKIGHAELLIGDSKIMLADEHPEVDALSPRAYGGSPIGIHLYVPDVDEIVKHAVEAGATLLREPETMFYGDRNASIIDPFGHKWYVATHVKDVSLEEMKQHPSQC